MAETPISLVTTDYRKIVKSNGTDCGPMMPSRFCSYMRDLLQFWFANPSNILDDQLKNLLYIPAGSEDTTANNAAIAKNRVQITTAYPYNSITSDMLPRVAVFSQNLQTTPRESINLMDDRGINGFYGMKQSFFYTYDLGINVYTPTDVLTLKLCELLFVYLDGMRRVISEDSYTTFIPVNMKVAQLEQVPGSSQDVFVGSIVCQVSITGQVNIDTVGPTYKATHIE